ncbi:Zinc finger, RAN-binding domain containing 2 [Perkinsus chesapeaki]|uniref:Zinc finger, RAN-binding domain containing 2 n=1 Tax=Perkinsus chesapeaki TaxID=330153 RepID=A0A7J6MHP8_PERCH|nr:Zinc finger, RAN-binding domain containing 2 [Perkinsus chesapeaki]
MITYDNKQSAFRLILQLSGSVFPRAIPPAVAAAVLAMCLGLDVLPFIPPTIDHPFAVQIFAIVLGYVIVFRTNMALGRYREGITNVQVMVSKWGDAFMQINAFLNVRARSTNGDTLAKVESLRVKLLHWFTLLSAIAMMQLNGSEVDLVNGFKFRPLESNKHMGRRSFLQGRAAGRRGIRRGSLIMPRTSLMVSPTHMLEGSQSSSHPFPLTSSACKAGLLSLAAVPYRYDETWVFVFTAKLSFPDESVRIPNSVVLRRIGSWYFGIGLSGAIEIGDVKAYNSSRLTVVGECSEEEVRFLDMCSNKSLVVARWISESVSRSCLEGIITVPPPVLSRCYQEISNGMLGFNQALKVTLVPFPFPFAQLLALLLLVFAIICPTMIVKMTVGKILSPVLSFFAVLGYWGLNQIAVELENPFGDDKNDLPLDHVHTAFVDGIHDCAFAGLAEVDFVDYREVTEGPPPVPLTNKDAIVAAPSPSELTVVVLWNDSFGIPSGKLFSARLRFCDLLLLKESDLKDRFGENGALVGSIYRRIRALADRHSIRPRRLFSMKADLTRPESSTVPAADEGTTRPSRVQFGDVTLFIMNPPGVSYPPPPGYTHAQVQQMLQAQQQVKKAPSGRPNDWQCPNVTCRHWNYEKRSRCNRCDTPKPIVQPEVPSLGGPPGLFKKGDWVCTGCGNVNWDWRERCNMCNTLQPQLQESREGQSGGHYDRQDPTDRERHDSDNESLDEFGRKKKKNKHKRHRYDPLAQRQAVESAAKAAEAAADEALRGRGARDAKGYEEDADKRVGYYERRGAESLQDVATGTAKDRRMR